MANNRIWYYMLNGKQTGPVSIDELREEFRHGRAPVDTMAWRLGMADWQPANTLPELKSKPSQPSHQLDMEAQIWYYEYTGKNFGPLKAKDIAVHIAEGTLPHTISVWHEEMEAWAPASEQPEFANVQIKARKLTRPPMAPHQKKVTKQNLKPVRGTRKRGEALELTATDIIGAEGVLTLGFMGIIGIFWLFDTEGKYISTFNVLCFYGGLTGIIMLVRAFVKHPAWLAVCILIPLGELPYMLFDIKNCWRIFINMALFCLGIYLLFYQTDWKSSPERKQMQEQKADFLWFDK